MDEKQKAARISILSNFLLTSGKLAVGLSINSISVISEAVHSGIDLIAALIAFFSVNQSGKPADQLHPYGHGKFENLAAAIEALLILVAAGFILWEAVPHMIAGEGRLHTVGWGVAVMGGSALVNAWVSMYLMRVAKKTDSPALKADALHLRTDVLTSIGVFVGLIAIRLTGLTVLDSLVAIVVALLIVKAAYNLISDSLMVMLDSRLPAQEEQAIIDVLAKYAEQYVKYYQLRTRKAGSQRYIDLHLVVPANQSVIAAHRLCNRIEEELQERLPQSSVLIHYEPCDTNCPSCSHCPNVRK